MTKLTRGDATTVAADDAKVPFAPRARVRVKRGSSSVEEVVELGPGTELVRRAFDGARLHVPSVLGRRLWPSEIALPRPNGVPWRPRRGDAALARDVGATRSGSRWRSRPAGGRCASRKATRADALATADVVALVRNAQAESWFADQDDGSFGLEDGSCKVEVDGVGDAGARTLGIVFGKEAEDGTFYARTATDRAVFLAPRALREAATTWLVDRDVFRAAPASVDRVTLSRGTARAVFVGRHQTVDGGASDTTSRLLTTLETLRPDTVVHLGAARASEGFDTPTLDVRVKVVSDAGSREIHFVLGDTALVNRERIVYARMDGVNATYGIARDRLGPLMAAL